MTIPDKILISGMDCVATIGVSAEEQKIIAYIDNHNDEAIALLEKVVNIESPT